MGAFPATLHICTYDVRGTLLATGETKVTRETGLVAHTHQLLHALARRHPQTRIAVTQSGAATPRPAEALRTPEGLTVELRTVATRFPELRGPRSAKDPDRVRHYYEDTIDDAGNVVWRSLAEQYALVVCDAGTPDLLLQNVNPLISVLKAEEFGLIGGGLRITGVIHDAAGAHNRFGYLARRLASGSRLNLIAVSECVRQDLIDAGVPSTAVRKVLNGLDVPGFQYRLWKARENQVFERVRRRNQLPAGCRMLLVSARRVEWKGQEDVIRAVHLLSERGRMGGVYALINGAGMTDTRTPGYEAHLRELIGRLGLEQQVVLLDELTAEEVAACYTAADIALLPSREPEPFGYANLEAMLACVPVIATGHGGPLEYITHNRSGLLVPPRDPAAIAAAVEILLTDRETHARIAAAGNASAQHLTVEAMFNSYEDALTTAPGVLEGAGTL